MKLFDIKGKNIILIGCLGILGKEYVQYLNKQGANLFLGDYRTSGWSDLKKKLSKGPNKIQFEIIDLLNKNSIDEFLKLAGIFFNNEVDGLINNAQVKPEGFYKNFETYEIDVLNEVVSGNLTSVIYTCQNAILSFPKLKENGTIINISSTYGIVAADQRLYDGVENIYQPNQKFTSPISYGISKAGIVHLTKYLASYYRNTGLRINCLTPGGVFDNHDEVFVNNYSSRTTLGRMARRDEYNGAIHFLLSNASSYMTGSNLIIDGGWSVC